MAGARRFAACGSVGGRLLVCGGETEDAVVDDETGPVSESIAGRRPAWDIFELLCLASIELVFHGS